MIEPTQTLDRLNDQDQPNHYANVAAFNRRKVLEVDQVIRVGGLTEVERCDLRHTLSEVASDLQALEQYCEQAEAEINSICTPG